MCTVEEYKARIRRLPLTFDRLCSDNEAALYRDASGMPVRIQNAETFRTDELREAGAAFYESQYLPAGAASR